MKKSKSSHPILVSKHGPALARQMSFISDKQSKQFGKQKCSMDEIMLEKVLLEAEESYKKGEYETALLKFNEGASLKPKSEAIALGIQKSQIAIINDLKNGKINIQESKEQVNKFNSKNFEQSYSYFGPESKTADQKSNKKLSMQQKTGLNGENVYTDDYKLDTAKSIFTNFNQKSSDQLYNLKVYDGSKFKVVSATKHDVKEYMKDKDYFKMKKQNAKEWKKLRSEMNKKIAEKEAIERYEKEAKLLEEKSSIRQYCEEQIVLIGRYYQNGKISDVVRFSENFIKYLNKKNDKLLPRKWVYLATTFNYLGRAFIEQENFEKAKTFGEKLYKIAISSTNTELIAQSYILSGKIYVKFGKFEEAAFVWEKLKPLIDDHEKKSWLFHEIGRCYFEMGKYDISYKYGVDSAYWAEKCSSSKWICSANVLQGQCDMKRNNYANALKKFHEAKKHAELSNNESLLKYIESIQETLTIAFNRVKT